MRGDAGLAIISRGAPPSTITPPSMNASWSDFAGKADLVGNDNHRHAAHGKVAHDLQDSADQFRIERRGRLVEEQHLGLHRHGARDRDTLLLAPNNSRG